MCSYSCDFKLAKPALAMAHPWVPDFDPVRAVQTAKRTVTDGVQYASTLVTRAAPFAQHAAVSAVAYTATLATVQARPLGPGVWLARQSASSACTWAQQRVPWRTAADSPAPFQHRPARLPCACRAPRLLLRRRWVCWASPWRPRCLARRRRRGAPIAGRAPPRWSSSAGRPASRWMTSSWTPCWVPPFLWCAAAGYECVGCVCRMAGHKPTPPALPGRPWAAASAASCPATCAMWCVSDAMISGPAEPL